MMEHEKVKLPRPIYNVLKAQGFSIHGIKRDKGSFFPITTLWGMATVSDKSEPSEYEALTKFLYSNSENQWLLIDALRYGYEAEPEPRWGIKAGNCWRRDYGCCDCNCNSRSYRTCDCCYDFRKLGG